MSLVTNIQNAMTRVATEIKALRTLINGNASDLSSLTTTAKTNLVVAINEVKGLADSAAGGGVSINDAATNTTQTWSSSKIDSNNPTWLTIANKPAFVAEGATAAAARTAIGAGTSDLAIGTTGTTAAAGNRAASETAIGMVELATTTEATTGTDTTRAITAAGLKAVADTKANTSHTHTASQISDATATGRSVLQATDAAAARTAIGAGTSSLVIGTAAGTAAEGNRAASLTAIGMVELATTAETTTGTDTARAVTPAGVKAVADTKAALAHTHTAANVTDFTSAVDARIALVVDAAPAAMDTLNELAAALGDDPNFATTMTTALGNRVRVDAAQAFTAPQMLQARQNIDAVSATDIGDTTTNFVTTFEAALV